MPAAKLPPPEPKSTHTSDPLLAPFLGTTFDPTAYLNTHLPPLAINTSSSSTTSTSSSRPHPLPLQTHAKQTQTHLAQLHAHLSRLSGVLTAQADDVLRSGARLAYAVELLGGEARQLDATVAEGLADEVERFLPEGLEGTVVAEGEGKDGEASDNEGEGEAEGRGRESRKATTAAAPADGKTNGTSSTTSPLPPPAPNEPAALHPLRKHQLVRERLRAVTGVFDAALSWPLPPSSLSLGGAFVSVSAPAAGVVDPNDPSTFGAAPTPQQRAGGAGSSSVEEQGQKAQKVLRESVTELLRPGGREGGAEAVRRAEARVKELRELAGVWKGTGEEKARNKFVDGLAKMVEARRKELEARGEMGDEGEDDGNEDKREKSAAAVRTGNSTPDPGTPKKGGIFGGLRRLRDEIYLE